jgi:hypothetical protein
MKTIANKEMHEGPEAFARFQQVMKAVLAVPHAEIQRRIADHRKEVDNNPNRRGPKRKNASRVPPAS